MKALRIFLLFLLLLFPCLSVRAVEVYQTQPCIDWGDWTIGQSSGSGNAVVTTFITNSEKTACVKVAVKYCASQPSGFVYPIERFDFQITMNNGFEVKKKVEMKIESKQVTLDPHGKKPVVLRLPSNVLLNPKRR